MNSLLRSNYMSSLHFKIEQIIHNTVLTPVSDFRWDPVLHLLELNFLSLRLLPIVQPLVQAQVFIIRASIPSTSPKCTGNCLLWGRELLILQRILHSMGWVRSLKYMRGLGLTLTQSVLYSLTNISDFFSKMKNYSQYSKFGISTIYIQMSTIAFLLVILQIVDICNDIFTRHNVFLDIQNYS